MDEFGPRLRELRKKYGMTQADVANAIGTTTPEVSAWENGRQPPARALYLARATAKFETADALGLIRTAIVARGKVEFDVGSDSSMAELLAQLVMDLNSVGHAAHVERLLGATGSQSAKPPAVRSTKSKGVVLRRRV